MDNYCIYRISYNGPEYPHEMNYIGKAKNPEKRWGINGSGYNSMLLGDVIQKVGWDNMKKEILETNIPADKVNSRECYYTDKYNSLYRNGHGWNVNYGNQLHIRNIDINNIDVSSEIKADIWKYFTHHITAKETGIQKNCEFVFKYDMFENYSVDELDAALNELKQSSVDIVLDGKKYRINPFDIVYLSNGKTYIKIASQLYYGLFIKSL